MLQKYGEPTRKCRLNGCIEQLSFLKKMEGVFHEDVFEATKSSGLASRRRCRRHPYNQGLFAVLIL
jgi:hypothetical protein